MQPFTNLDFILDEPFDSLSQQSLSPADDIVPSPTSIHLDAAELQFMNDLKSFKWMAESIADPLSIYEPINPAKSESPRKIQRNGSLSDRSSVSSEYSSPSPPPTASSPLPQLSSSDDSVHDSLAALEKKLSQPTYTTAKENERVTKTTQDKPEFSYIAMIAKAILSTPQKRMILGDIYKYIMDNFPYYDNEVKAWRNSIRHNLSLNECFIKSGRCEGGKGNYWGIHPTCVEEFGNGDYRRRQARKRVRRGMKNMISALPSDKKETLPYVPMGASQTSRNSYHPYATPYATYRNTVQYNGETPNYVIQQNTYPLSSPVNPSSPSSYSSLSPTGFNSPSPTGFNASSPPNFNSTSPTSSYSNTSPTSYTNVSPTNYGNLKVDTSFGTNYNTACSTNITPNAYGTQGNGYSYQVPQNSLLMKSTDTNAMQNCTNFVDPNVTVRNGRFDFNGNYQGMNAGLLQPMMSMPSSHNSCVYSC